MLRDRTLVTRGRAIMESQRDILIANLDIVARVSRGRATSVGCTSGAWWDYKTSICRAYLEHTFQCFRVGAPVGLGNRSRFHWSSTHFPLSPVDLLLKRPNALKPPRLMKLLFGRRVRSPASSSSSVFGLAGGAFEGNSFGRNTAGIYRGRVARPR